VVRDLAARLHEDGVREPDEEQIKSGDSIPAP
jgi:hypothetical protein